MMTGALEFIEVKKYAPCPTCGKLVLVSFDMYGQTRQIGSCPHMDHIERLDGTLFVAFRREAA